MTDAAPSTASGRPTLLLLDGHSLAFRAFYALPAQNFSTTGGQHTNAVYGFLGMLLGLVENEHPTHIATAFDLSGPTFRSETFPEYKAQRPSTPPEFHGQVELIQETLQALGVTTLTKEAYEADDIIATLATRGAAAGMRVLICTGDRDSFQLVTEDVTVLYTLKGVSELDRFTPARVEEKYGVTPTQYPDLAALRGDTSDNMPGVPGVGPKTAQKWITGYGSLEGVVEHKDEIGGKVGQNLRDHLADVLLARNITEMVRDLDLGEAGQLEALTPGTPDPTASLDMFEALQFGTTLRNRAFRTFGVEFEDGEAAALTMDAPATGKLATWLTKHAGWKVNRPAGDAAVHRPLAVTVTGVGTPAGGRADRIALLDPVVGEDGALHAVDIDLTDQDPADEATLRAWLADRGAPKWVHDAKAEWHKLNGSGLVLAGVEQDTALAAYLLRPDLRTGDLADVVQRHVGHEITADAPGAVGAQATAALVAPLTPELCKQVREELGVPGVANSWGLTEFPVATSPRTDAPPAVLDHTVGPPVPGVRVRTVDEHGCDVPAGAEGELLLSGPQCFLGYVDSGLDAAAFTDDGWFRSGDLGRIDPDGNVVVTGRLKDAIIRNAENISALEIENLLSDHPGVDDVAVIGVPDSRTGERVCAVVVPAIGAQISLGTMAAHCSARGLSRHKIPERLELVDALPRNLTGKVLKTELRSQFN